MTDIEILHDTIVQMRKVIALRDVEIEQLRAGLSIIAEGEEVEAAAIARNTLAATQQITEKPIRIQCKCGWIGNQNELTSIPGGKSCPECDAIFHPFPNHEKA